MRGDRRGDIQPRQRVKLFQKENRRLRVIPALAFSAQFVANLAAGDQNALRILYLAIWN